MSQNKSLKSLNTPYLASYVILNVIVFIGAIVFETGFETVIESISWKDSIYAVFAPAAAIVINGFIGAETKARIVFMKWNNPLPGSSAFTKHIFNDSRFSANEVREKWGSLPTEPGEQNRQWYRLYREVEDDVRVQDVHKNWLLTRDLAAATFVFIVFFFGVGILSTFEVPGWYYWVMLIPYLTFTLSARRYAERFVTTSIAVALKG